MAASGRRRRMDWTRFAHGQRLNPIAGGTPAATVVLLPDLDQPVAPLLAIAARWAAMAPTTAFVAFGVIRQFDLGTYRQWRSTLGWRFDASRVVLVGFGQGATVALDLALHRGCRCAGVLGFSPRQNQRLPRIISIDAKIRLVECDP